MKRITNTSRRSTLKSPDVVSRQYKLPFAPNQTIKVQFWDQAASSNLFPKIVLQQTKGVVLVVDVNDKASFDKIAEWSKRIEQEFPPNTQKILVANKVDNEGSQRAFGPLEGHKVASNLGFIGYYEVSALENINIDKPI
jgi:GTPase SAR1 family protein